MGRNRPSRTGLSGDELVLGLFIPGVGRWWPRFLLLLDLNLLLNDRGGRRNRLGSGGPFFQFRGLPLQIFSVLKEPISVAVR